MKHLIFISLLLLAVTSCKKEETDPNNQSSCSENDGYFHITVDAVNYDMVVDETTHFSILYNWFGYQESAFVIESTDQNTNPLNVEMAYPGTIDKGTSSYTDATLDFSISVDTFNLSVSTVTFDISKSNLSQQDGIYRPLIGSFNGEAAHNSGFGGQAVSTAHSISGTFCLNGVILN